MRESRGLLGFSSIIAVLASVGCGASPQQGDEVSAVSKQRVVPTADLCDPIADQCKVAISVPMGVNMLDVALAGVSSVRANDRVQIGSSGGLLPVIMSVGQGQSRVGADASVGHVWAAGNLELADRAVVRGELVLDTQAPAPNISSISRILEDTATRTFNSKSRTIWTVKWPTQSVSSLEAATAAAGGTALSPNTDYGTVFVRSGEVLNLNTAGNYYIRNLTLDSGGKIQIANGQLIRLAVSGIPVLNGDVVVADQKDTAAPKFLMAVLTSGSVAVSGTFQGLLLAPAASIAITGYGNSQAPLPQRGAFWGFTTEMHQGAVFTQGVDPNLFMDPGEGVIADDATDPSSNLVKYVPSVGYLDGTSCDNWPKDVQRTDIIDGVIGGLSSSVVPDVVSKLETALQELNVSTLVNIGSNRGLTLASYTAEVSPDGTLKRHWVAVDDVAGVGYDLSQQYLCSGQDVLNTAVTPAVCKRQTMALNFGSTIKQVQVLRRVATSVRTRDDTTQSVLLVAPTIQLDAPPDGYAENTLQLDVNLVVAAKNVIGSSRLGTPVNLDIKPFTQTKINGPADLAGEIAVPSKPGIVAVFADSISNVGVISTHNAIRVARYTPMDGLPAGQIRPIVVNPSYGAPTGDVSVYSEYIYPKKWVLEYRCPTSTSVSTGANLTSPPDYFCQQWQTAPAPSNSSSLMCNYAISRTQTGSAPCAQLWCNGTLKNGVNYYTLTFTPTTARESVSCDATAHTGLLNRRYTADKGGWAILAAGTGGNSVELRAPQGEATVHNTDFIRSTAINSVINSDVLTALSATHAFSASPPASWPNPSDLSVPAQNPTTPRCTFTENAWAMGGSVSMNCSFVNSPFNLNSWFTDSFDAYTGQAGYSHAAGTQYSITSPTINTAATSINNITTSYLLQMDTYKGPVNTFQQRTLTNLTATAANVGAQIASGGDYFKLLDRLATNAAMPNAVPGAEFDQLRAVTGNLAPITVSTLSNDVHLSATQISTAEQQRIIAFADAYRARSALTSDYNQPWLVDITGTPYGNVLTGWLPQWFGATSPSTLLEIKTDWDSVSARAVEFYNLKKNVDLGYDYTKLYSATTGLLSTVASSANASALASTNALPSQVQSLDTLTSTVKSVSDNMAQLNTDIRKILKASDTATDQDLENLIAGQITTALTQCSQRNTPSDPFGALLGTVASLVPYVSNGVTLMTDITNGLDDVTTALDKANQGTQYFLNFNDSGTVNYIDNWVNFSQPIIGFLKPVEKYLSKAGDVASKMADVATAVEGPQFQGNCPTSDPASLAAESLLANLANEQAIVRVMQGQLSTLAGAIEAISGNADYYRSSGAAMGQLSSDATRLATQLSDSQVTQILGLGDWRSRREGLLLACEGAQAAIAGRLPMLAELSRSLTTNAGRNTTSAGLMIPAWDSANTAYGDQNPPLPYNLWDPTQQVVVTGAVYTAGSSTVSDSFMNMAWNRWTGSNHTICNATVDGGAGGRLVFDLKKVLSGTDLANFLQNGWVDFSITFSDWLNAYSMDSNISPSVWRKDPASWSALLSAPVVWNVAFQACTGSIPTDHTKPFDPCCDSTNTGCMTPLWIPDGSGVLEAVRMSAGWVPTNNSNCDSVATEVDVNPNYFVDNRRPPANNPSLFPLATQTCKSNVLVPSVYQPAKDVSNQTRRNWALSSSDELCATTGSETWAFTPLRGVPLLGDWVLANTFDNGQLIAHYDNMFPLKDGSNNVPPVVPPPPASFAANNSNITAIRVLISAMAEPTSSQGPAVYTLLTSAPPAANQ